MVFGLLTLAAIPTTIGVAEAISASKKKEGDEEEEDPTVASTTEAQRMRKFRLQCYCDAPSSKAKEIDGGTVILRDDRLWIQPLNITTSSSSPSSGSSSFLGFYIPYPDPSRHPPPLGLVSFTPTTPPSLNWIYVAHPARDLRYGNRTASIAHCVGPWAWDTGSDDHDDDGASAAKAGDNGGGLTLAGKEGCVAVEMEEGWQLFWEDETGVVPSDDQEGCGSKARRKLQVSVERIFVEDAPQDVEEGKEKGKGKEKEKNDTKVKGGVEVRNETAEKKQARKTEATVEVKTKSKSNNTDEKKEEEEEEEKKTRYEYRA